MLIMRRGTLIEYLDDTAVVYDAGLAVNRYSTLLSNNHLSNWRLCVLNEGLIPLWNLEFLNEVLAGSQFYRGSIAICSPIVILGFSIDC